MTDYQELKESGRRITLNSIEIIVLLLLPLPFLHLNVLYVVSALVIMLLSKYIRNEK